MRHASMHACMVTVGHRAGHRLCHNRLHYAMSSRACSLVNQWTPMTISRQRSWQTIYIIIAHAHGSQVRTVTRTDLKGAAQHVAGRHVGPALWCLAQSQEKLRLQMPGLCQTPNVGRKLADVVEAGAAPAMIKACAEPGAAVT